MYICQTREQLHIKENTNTCVQNKQKPNGSSCSILDASKIKYIKKKKQKLGSLLRILDAPKTKRNEPRCSSAWVLMSLDRERERFS